MKLKQIIASSLLCAFLPFFNPCYAQDLYSNGERMTGLLLENWNPQNTWENYNRFALTYTTPTTVQLSREYWDGFSWNALGKGVITLNPNYSFSTIMWQRWNGAQAAWLNDSRTTYTYFNNDPTKTLVFKSDTANRVNNAIWDDDRRETHTYNANGLALQELNDIKNGTTWEGNNRVTYTYNANSLKKTSLVQLGQGGGAWSRGNKSMYYYNTNNLLSLRIDSVTMNVPSLVANVKVEYVYNANNLLAQEIETYYNRTTGILNNYISAKKINTYNTQNLRTQQTYESYDFNLSALTLNYSIGYTYNNAKNILVETYINQKYPPASTRTTYTYATYTGTENTAPAFEFSVFPNPTAEQINIGLAENSGVTAALIMSANGQVVKTQNLTSAQSTINVQDLAAGSYQIILLQNGKSAAKSFVKQ